MHGNRDLKARVAAAPLQRQGQRGQAASSASASCTAATEESSSRKEQKVASCYKILVANQHKRQPFNNDDASVSPVRPQSVFPLLCFICFGGPAGWKHMVVGRLCQCPFVGLIDDEAKLRLVEEDSR